MPRTKPKAEPRPKGPPDDEPGPQLLTGRRAANQVEALYLDLARIVGRLEALTHYTDSRAVRESINALTAELKALQGIRARLLTGDIAITRGEDRESYAARQPLIAAIEANGTGHHADDVLDTNVKPAPNRKCNRCGVVRTGAVGVCPCGNPEFSLTDEPATIRPPARVAGRRCKDCGHERPAKEKCCPRCGGLKSTPCQLDVPNAPTEAPRRPARRSARAATAETPAEPVNP